MQMQTLIVSSFRVTFETDEFSLCLSISNFYRSLSLMNIESIAPVEVSQYSLYVYNEVELEQRHEILKLFQLGLTMM